MVEYKAGPRRREPTHPGKIVASSIGELGISQRVAALSMGVTPMALANVIHCQSGVSPEMALRLGRFFGNGPQLWLGMQADHDLWKAERAIGDQVAKITPAKVAFDA